MARFEVTGGCRVSSQGNLDVVNPLSLGEAISSVQKFFLLWKFPALGCDLVIDDTLQSSEKEQSRPISCQNKFFMRKQ